MKKNNNGKLKIIHLGGLGEIGKNITVLEYMDEILIIDCGLAFPDEEMLGIDLVLPDISYLEKNSSKIKGVVITHGHEDHIGNIPYLLKKINVPIYGTRLSVGLIRHKLLEHRVDDPKLIEVSADQKIVLGAFIVHFIRTNHSIPDAVALAITTPIGVIFHTGDFKIDFTPIKMESIDLQTIAEYGKNGVLLAFSDSTNVEQPGYTLSESTVGDNFFEMFKKAKKRIVVATFASNIHRVQQIIYAAKTFKRKVVISGRSMINVVKIGKELGYLDIEDSMLVDENDINKYNDKELVIISTGSQGEPMAALSKMAANEHRKIKLKEGDMVIISASPIPGNEKTVSRVINQLYARNIEVIYEAIRDIHVSGHAKQEELKLMLALLKPKYFIPVHGEHRHLRKHADLAESMGVKKKNIIVAEIGDIVEVTKQNISIVGKVQSGNVLVDGLGVGDVGNIVLRDRRNLSENGLIISIVTIDRKNKKIISGPEIVSRGFIYMRENVDIVSKAKEISKKSVENCFSENQTDWNVLKNAIRDDLSKYIYEDIKRSPVILPIIMEVKNQ